MMNLLLTEQFRHVSLQDPAPAALRGRHPPLLGAWGSAPGDRAAAVGPPVGRLFARVQKLPDVRLDGLHFLQEQVRNNARIAGLFWLQKGVQNEPQKKSSMGVNA